MTTLTDADEPVSDRSVAPRWWRVGATVREDVRTTVAAHERFARETEAALSRVARCEVGVQIVSSEWMSFGEYLACLMGPATLARLELPGAPTGMIIELGTGTGLRLLDRLLGGSGAPLPERPPTELEVELLGDVLSAVAGAVGQVLKPVLTSAPQVSQLTTQPELLRLVGVTEPTLILTYQVRADLSPPSEGLLTLCYPSSTVEMLLSEIGQPSMSASAHPAVPPDPRLRDLVGEVDVVLRARLQPSQVSADDLRRLAVGDVLTLDHRRDHPIAVSIGETLVLEGVLGRHGRAVAVQILQWRVSHDAVIKGL
jgi:flagellar motor switch protein FliM